MRAAAMAYRPRWQAYAHGRGVRHDFRSPRYVVPRELELRRTNDIHGSDHLLPLGRVEQKIEKALNAEGINHRVCPP